MSTTPFELLVSRLDGVKRRGDRVQAKCPAHADRAPSLSARPASDGTALVRCFAGCTLVAIVNAVGLELRDLFPPRSAFERRKIDDAHDALMRRFRADREGVVRELIEREIDVECARLELKLGYCPPLTSVHINAARRRVSLFLAIELQPLAPLIWECAPHDEDPAWPSLFERELRMVLIAKYGDPHREPTKAELQVAASWAARDLHELAKSAGFE